MTKKKANKRAGGNKPGSKKSAPKPPAAVPAPKRPAEQEPPAIPEDSRLQRNGDELYARVVRCCPNERMVIVCPYLDGFTSGRMVLPKSGGARTEYINGQPIRRKHSMAQRGKKLWVRLIDEKQKIYEYVS